MPRAQRRRRGVSLQLLSPITDSNGDNGKQRCHRFGFGSLPMGTGWVREQARLSTVPGTGQDVSGGPLTASVTSPSAATRVQ